MNELCFISFNCQISSINEYEVIELVLYLREAVGYWGYRYIPERVW